MSKDEILKELDTSIADKNRDYEYISKLNRTIDKVKYLRLVKNYTQSSAAEIIGISPRHVRRLERKLKNN